MSGTAGSDPAPTAPAAPAEPGDRAARLVAVAGDLDELAARFARAQQIPGLAYGVVADGHLAHAAGVGVGALGDTSPPTVGTAFRIASMTKSFTAMCALSLRDEGRLDLDQPVAELVPELAGLRLPTSDSPPLSTRALLTMAAGFVEDDAWGDRHLGMAHEALARVLAGGVGFDLPPSTGWEYSNLGYAVVGRAVAAAAGMPLRDAVQARVLTPLAMTATTWDADALASGRSATGYRVQGGGWVAEASLPDGAFGAMGGLASSVGDLARYIAFHLSGWPARDDPDDGPLRRSSVREMAQVQRALPVAPDPEGGAGRVRQIGYGFGLVVGSHPAAGRVVGHSGGLPGWSSHMEWLPDAGIGVVALANRTYRPVRDLVRSMLDRAEATGALAPRALEVPPALLAARAAVVALYERWDDATARHALLDTYLLDLDDDRRPPDLAGLRGTHGACTGVGDVTATGALRGSWRMACAEGDLDVAVVLGPTLPPRIQQLAVTPAAVQAGA